VKGGCNITTYFKAVQEKPTISSTQRKSYKQNITSLVAMAHKALLKRL